MKTARNNHQWGKCALVCFALLIVGSLIIGCEFDFSSKPPPGIKTSTGGTGAITIKAIPGVTAPVTGAVPVAEITETDQYTGTITWNDFPDVFAPNTVYTATITLTPKGDYTLQGVAADFFTVAGAETVTNDANSGIVTAVFPKTGDATVSIKAIPGVTPPEFGEIPVTAIAATDQYTGTVTWSPELNGEGGFKGETAYTATITLTAKTNYTLDGVAANFFTVAGAQAVTNVAGSGVVTAVFQETLNAPPTLVDISAISGVTAPVTGAAPVAEITETAQYTGTVIWEPELSAEGKFKGEEAYTATIYLTAKRGHTFNGVTANFFTVAGTSTPATNAENLGEVTAKFPETLPAVIDIKVILGVTAPVAGATPVTAITETAQYSGTVTWSPSVATAFAPDTKYTATITLTAKKGYTLTGVEQNFFTVAGTSTPATSAANSGVVTAEFAKTTAIVINTKAIQGVTAPEAGATPVTTITETAQYTGTVTWSPSVATTFAYDTVYTATITLTPKPTYTLEGVAANFFTVAGATTVTNAANSGTVTAVFPKTPEPFIIAGYYTLGYTDKACYWKDGVQHDLDGSQATAVALDGDDIYIAGCHITNNEQYPCYWKISASGTTRVVLNTPAAYTYNGSVSAIAVENGNVYVAGACQVDDGGYKTKPYYWKNNSIQLLTLFTQPEGNVGVATAIAVEGGTVYVAGYYNNNYSERACFWPDVTADAVLLTEPNSTAPNANANAIAVTGGTVYIAGYDGTPCYWTETSPYQNYPFVTKTDLSGSDRSPNAIAVSGSTVYTAGYNYTTTGTPCYWTNGTKTDLSGTGDGASANDIAVLNGTVYVAGVIGNFGDRTACYWKDGTRTDLPGANSVAMAMATKQ